MGVCSICLETRTRPCCCVPCGHLFCRDCIEAWFTHTRICPDCRKEIDSLQSVFGLEKETQNTGTPAAGPQPTVLPLISKLQQRIHSQRCWYWFIASTAIFTFFLLIDLITGTSGGWTLYIFQSTTSAMLSIIWDLSAMVFNVLIALLKFPFHFVLNLPSYCDSLSNFLHHLFWFVIYAVIVVLVVWYCVHTVLITMERKEWKMKRKKKH